MNTSTLSLFAVAVGAALAAQTQVVVPAAYATTDALSYEWLAGATSEQRQQVLVGASHLAGQIGGVIQTLELRRTAVAETYLPGSMQWTVTLSTSPLTPVACSNVFADNVGLDATVVFQGTVSLPASPLTGGPGSTIGWTPQNVVRVDLATPFRYTGGTLCIDIVGTPILGQETWWMADAAEEVVAGAQLAEIGAGCGVYGGPQRAWSEVAVRSLVPGGRGQFRANGPANGPALAMFGLTGIPNAFPLSLLGVSTPNCWCHLDPLSILVMLPVVFEPETNPLAFPVATAEVLVPIPAAPAVFGFQLTTQWFDLTQLATSNAFTWTVASAIPALDMALVEGHPSGTTGTLTNYLAPVLRFEFQ